MDRWPVMWHEIYNEFHKHIMMKRHISCAEGTYSWGILLKAGGLSHRVGLDESAEDSQNWDLRYK